MIITEKLRNTTNDAYHIQPNGVLVPSSRCVILPFERERAVYDDIPVLHEIMLNCNFNPLQEEVRNDLSEPSSSWFFRVYNSERLVAPVSGLVVDARTSDAVSCDGYLAAHETNLVTIAYQAESGVNLLRLEHLIPGVELGQRVTQGEPIGVTTDACGENHLHMYARDTKGRPVKLRFANRPTKCNEFYELVEQAARKLPGKCTATRRRSSAPTNSADFFAWRDELLRGTLN